MALALQLQSLARLQGWPILTVNLAKGKLGSCMGEQCHKEAWPRALYGDKGLEDSSRREIQTILHGKKWLNFTGLGVFLR